MTQGQRFLDKCKQTQINPNPWPHQIIEDTLNPFQFAYDFIGIA